MLASSVAFGQAEGAPSRAVQILGAMHEVNLLEMRAGTLARDKGSTPEVRRFGTLIYRDHRAADDMVVRLSRHYGFAHAPPAPPAQAEQDEWTLRQLQTSSGAEFDRRFLDSTIGVASGAAMSMRAFEPDVAQKDVRAMMDKVVPILQQHVAIAKELRHRP